MKYSSNKIFKVILSNCLAFALVLGSLCIPGTVVGATQATSDDDYKLMFEDDFNRSDRDIHDDNGWYSVWDGSTDKPSHKIANECLSVEDYSNGGANSYSERPTTENAVNQRVSVDIMNLADLSNYSAANVYLRYFRGNRTQNSDYGYRVSITNEYIELIRDGNLWNKDALEYGGERVNYSIYYGHQYRVVFTANGVSPTRLCATLYDVTAGNVAVASVSGIDNTYYLQKAGTAALGSTANGAGQLNAVFDNFKYEYIPENETFTDDFNRNDGAIGNNWVAGDMANVSIESNLVKLQSNNRPEQWEGIPRVSESALVRPTSEASLNQVVWADFQSENKKPNIGGALIARCQGEKAADDNCYRFVVRLGLDNADGYQTPIYLYNSKGLIFDTPNSVWVASDQKYRLRMEVVSISDTQTKITIGMYSISEDGTLSENFSHTLIDEDAALQSAGTAGFSVYNPYYEFITVDNFNCREMANNEVIFDDFNCGNGAIGNGWVTGSMTNANISSGVLKLQTNHPAYTYDPQIFETALIRPQSEAKLNQVVSAEFKSSGQQEEKANGIWADQGGALIARCQGETPNAGNCYYAYACLGCGADTAWATPVYVYSSEGLISQDTVYIGSDMRYRMQLSVISLDDERSLLNIKFEGLNDDGTVAEVKLDKSIVDTDTNLQSAGTAGFSMFDKWTGTVDVDNFSYTVPSVLKPDTFYVFNELENENTYANNYVNTADADAFNERSVKAVDEIGHTPSNQLATVLNENSGYLAYPVYAEYSGTYSFKLRYRFNCDNASSYESYKTENGIPGAVAVVNGQKYTFSSSALLGTFGTSNEVKIALNEGVNVLYLMAPSSELVTAISGAAIDYDCLFVENTLTACQGTFVLSGDVNGDKTVDIRDLVRMKRYLVKDTVSINRFAADVNTQDEDSVLNAQDLSLIRTILLKGGLSNSEIDALSWLKFVDHSVMNTLSVLPLMQGGAMTEAAAMEKSVLNSADELTVTGTKYYLSENGDDNNNGTSPATAWRTLKKLNSENVNLQSGDGVFFERGSTFRQELDEPNGICAVSGVSYGAYGTGAKPLLLGSAQNYADAEWTEHYGNIWKIDFTRPDAGVIVFDNGSNIGVKKMSLSDLQSGFDFYHDTEENVLYLCCDLGCPSDVFNNIEIGVNSHFLLMNGRVSNVKIDNLDVRYVGAHAIRGANDNRDISITNCAISWIGGSMQNETVRYGNAIEFWSNCGGILVDNCLVEQVYDAGLTFQGGNGSQYSDIFFTNNLIRYCNYSVEFFIQKPETGETEGLISNVDFIGNIMQFAGYGFCEQRPSKVDSAHICGWETEIGGNLMDFCIKDNVFDLAAYNIINWKWTPNLGMSVSGNTYFMASAPSDGAMNYGTALNVTAVNQTTLNSAVAVFDSAPTAVTWLGK